MKIKSLFCRALSISAQKRYDTLLKIPAPQVILDTQKQIIDSYLNETFKFPGEIRGFIAPYLKQEADTIYSSHNRYFTNEISYYVPILDSNWNYLKLYKDQKYNNFIFTRVSVLPDNIIKLI